MTGRFLLALLLIASPLTAFADTTIRAHESIVQDGKSWGESHVEYHSSHGLRIDITVDGETSPSMSILFLRQPDRVYFLHGGSVDVLDREKLRAQEDSAPAAGPTPRIVALKTHRTVEGFACSDFELQREGLPTRYLCLAPAKSLRLSPELVADMRDLQGMMSRSLAVIERSHGLTPNAFNIFALTEGYPVRAWETSDGTITWESQILSVQDGTLSPDLFQVPEPPK